MLLAVVNTGLAGSGPEMTFPWTHTVDVPPATGLTAMPDGQYVSGRVARTLQAGRTLAGPAALSCGVRAGQFMDRVQTPSLYPP